MIKTRRKTLCVRFKSLNFDDKFILGIEWIWICIFRPYKIVCHLERNQRMNARQTVTIQNPCILLCDFCDESKTLLSVVLFSFFYRVFPLPVVIAFCAYVCVCAFFYVVFRRHFVHLNEMKNYLANEFKKKKYFKYSNWFLYQTILRCAFVLFS